MTKKTIGMHLVGDGGLVIDTCESDLLCGGRMQAIQHHGSKRWYLNSLFYCPLQYLALFFLHIDWLSGLVVRLVERSGAVGIRDHTRKGAPCYVTAEAKCGASEETAVLRC